MSVKKVAQKAQVRFGAMAPKLSEQVPGAPACLQDDADAVTRLYLRGLLTESEARRARHRIVRAIEMNVKADRDGTAD